MRVQKKHTLFILVGCKLLGALIGAGIIINEFYCNKPARGAEIYPAFGIYQPSYNPVNMQPMPDSLYRLNPK